MSSVNQVREIIIANVNGMQRILYENDNGMSPFNNARVARPMPQPGQGKPVIFFIKHLGIGMLIADL